MTTLVNILRRCRTLLWTALSILIILAAVGVGVGKLLMPLSARYQPQLEDWLSREFGRPVVLESFTGEWQAFGPRLRLRGMRLLTPGNGGTELTIEEAALDIKVLNALVPGRAWYNFLVIGADFSLIAGDNGGLRLSGPGLGDARELSARAGLRNLIGIGALILEDSSLEYTDLDRGVRLRLTGVDAQVQLDDESGSVTLNASLEDADLDRIFGEVEATALLEFSRDGRLSGARWHLSLQDLMLDPLRRHLPDGPMMPHQGLINGEFWGEWRHGQPMTTRGVADLRKGRLEHRDSVILIEHANARIGWSYGGSGDWRLDFNELRVDDGQQVWHAPNIALARNVPADVGLWISADALPLEVPVQLARDVLALYGEQPPAQLPESVAGEVADLDLVLDAAWRPQLVKGRIHGAAAAGWGRWPGFSGIDAEIDLKNGEGVIELHARELTVDWPDMFAETLRFSLPFCRADLDLRTGWQLLFRSCGLINDDLALNGDLLMSGNQGRPGINANFVISRANMGRLSPYWPQRIMKPTTVGWLRRSLREGDMEQGRFQIFGDMDDWPFRNGRGRFEASARVSGLTLDYTPGWPPARGLDADLFFAGPSMRIDGQVGDVGGVAVARATARIDDFRVPMLQVDYESDTTLPAMLGFLRRSPLLAAAEYDLDRFEFSGPASTEGRLRIPMGKAPGSLEVEGRANVAGGAFEDPATGIRIVNISGPLNYDREGLIGSGLDALYRERPAVLDVAVDQNSDERFRATLSGRFTVAEVLPELLQGAEPFGRMEGDSEWRASVIVPRAGDTADDGPLLLVESSLEGIAVHLPDPLGKPAAAATPLRLLYPLRGATRLLELNLADRLNLQMEVAMAGDRGSGRSTVVRAAAGLGGAAVGMPAAGRLRVQGRADSLNLDGWTDLVAQTVRRGDESGSRGAPINRVGELTLERFAVVADRLRFVDRQFADVALGLEVSPVDVRATFAGETVDGRVLFTPGTRGGSLSAEFERLVLDKPVANGIRMRSNPAELPELHLYARSFRYAGVEMGETRIEAWPTAGGFHFEKVEAESESLTLRASGDWLMQEDGPRSDFRILMTTESLGGFLESVDISTALTGGQTVLRFNAWWPGPPAAFALTRLNGEVEFSVGRGQITDASPGSGRLLGLLSIQALPRRLSLDFRDVFDEGFNFEEAHGTFRMENGMARTDDVELSSPAAKISVRGSTDLVSQRYDQILTVRPGVGNTLPVIGAIAGGPPGAAAGLALQGLLHGQLGEATQVQYTITGSWDKPSIEPLLKDGAESEQSTGGPRTKTD